MPPVRKAQFWLDNRTGALLEYTTEVNAVSLERMIEILEDTDINSNNVSRVQGIHSAQLPLNGYHPLTNTGIVRNLNAAFPQTSVSKTWQLKVGAIYYNGEAFVDGLKIGNADGKQLVPWSCNLMVDDGINVTSVAL